MSDQPDPGTGEAGPRESDSGPMEGNRQLTDPRDMRALAHPTRIALLEVLGVYGPLTATRAGELIGESPSSCSFHLGRWLATASSRRPGRVAADNGPGGWSRSG